MRAIGVRNGRGDASTLFIEENVPDPVASSSRILVSIKAFGLNRMDIMQREDKYPYPLLPESGKILGVEFSGIVEEVGPDCIADFKPGDRVFGLAYGGAYAEKISVSEKMLIHLPPSISFEEAAGIPETYFTAIQAIHLVGSMECGQRVLVHAGASGVGQAAIQIAKVGGASKVVTTAGTKEKCELCRGLGADVAVNYKEEDFQEVIESELGKNSIDLLVDLVGQSYWHRNTAVASMESKIVIVAAMSGSMIEGFNLRALLNKRLSVLATTLRTRNAEYQGTLRDKFVEVALPHLEAGRMKVIVDKVYSWRDVGDAHRRMESNINAGKIICVID